MCTFYTGYISIVSTLGIYTMDMVLAFLEGGETTNKNIILNDDVFLVVFMCTFYTGYISLVSTLGIYTMDMVLAFWEGGETTSNLMMINHH